jgi:hypothetical protein
MKKSLIILAVISLFGFKPVENPLTKQERDFAIQYMVQTRDAILQDVKGLSPAQLNYKADSTRWSVAQCVEHIALAENGIMMGIQMGLQSPADPSKRDSVKLTDQQVMSFLTDRSRKFQAPEVLKPDGRLGSYQSALDSFVARRNRNIQFVTTTQEDMRNHYFIIPGLAYLDDYQGILFLTAHSKRHTLQLEEVKNSPGFPKN